MTASASRAARAIFDDPETDRRGSTPSRWRPAPSTSTSTSRCALRWLASLLDDLADETLAIEAEFLDTALHGRWRFTEDDLVVTGLTPERGRSALSWLGAHGRIGYDPVERAWFRRELPFPREALTRDPPRLRDAKKLVAEGAVGDGEVRSGDKAYAVRLDPPHCSCPWWSKHPGDRGPCKHLLAARLAAASFAP